MKTKVDVFDHQKAAERICYEYEFGSQKNAFEMLRSLPVLDAIAVTFRLASEDDLMVAIFREVAERLSDKSRRFVAQTQEGE